MKVSIITVCLNSAATIEQTIQSVLGQTWKNIEYIIIDGQSTDGTLEIIDRYRDKITTCISEKDQGLYDAMNKGISVATGDIIGILNSDDWYAKDTVEKVVDAFQEEKADLVYGAMEIVHPGGYMSRVKNDALEYMLYRCVIPHPTVFVRRNVYLEVGVFDLEYKVLADYDLLMRMYLHHVKICQLPVVLTYFRKGGFSAEHATQCTEEMRSIARHYAQQRQDVKTLEKIDEYYQKRIKRAQAQDMAQELLSKHRPETAAMLQECLNGNKKIKIFGAGSVGTECFYFLREMGMEVECFLDNDESKCHEQFLEKPVQTCNSIESSDEEQYIVIAVVSYQEEIMKQLEDMGYHKDKDFWLFYELVEKMFQKLKEVKIIIPCFREYLTESEKISIQQCKKILSRYPMCIIQPDNLHLNIEELKGVEIETFDEKWFRSVQSYNELMLTKEFYMRFVDYEYILIYQMDAFVFQDELRTFCSLGYDYIGAPWLYGRFIYANGTGGYYYVGNGGFSLRKVKSHLQIIEKDCPDEHLNEDMFFSSRAQKQFRVAPVDVALKFAFETTVRKCYEKNGRKLPFGCHAWQKYDFSFYRNIFQESGYDVSNIKDGKWDLLRYNLLQDYSTISEDKFKETLKLLLPDVTKGIWIWGAGRIGKECCWLLEKNHIRVNGFIDNNAELHKSRLFGYEVKEIGEFLKQETHTPLLIAMSHVSEEAETVLEQNCRHRGKDYTSWRELEEKLQL